MSPQKKRVARGPGSPTAEKDKARKKVGANRDTRRWGGVAQNGGLRNKGSHRRPNQGTCGWPLAHAVPGKTATEIEWGEHSSPGESLKKVIRRGKAGEEKKKKKKIEKISCLERGHREE